MIHIEFEEPETAAWQDWRQRCDARQLAHNAAIQNGKTSTVTKLYAEQKPAVYGHPDGPFKGKCAYCEQSITDQHNQPGDVEHFRPKAAVIDEDGQAVQVILGGRAQEHPGYYWLAYWWRNLLLACNGCNRRQSDPRTREKIGKGKFFPVVGDHAVAPGEEQTERPLLLNPVDDHPEEHLSMDAETGILVAETDRGAETIRILGLNLRGLPAARNRTYGEVRSKFGTCALLAQELRGLVARAKQLFDELEAAKNGYGSHTMAVRKALADAKRDAKWLYDL